MDMLAKYKVVAKRYEDMLMNTEGALGVMHLGGVARERADEHSDIDIAVFSYDKLDIKEGEQLSEEGYDVEIFNICINKGFDDWDPIKKEAYAEGIIARDTNGIVKDFMDKALFYDDEFRCRYLAKNIFDIAWHGWIYTPFRNQNVKGYNWILPNNLWHQRGEISNDYYLTNWCINSFIELLFVVNRKWTPDFKWRWIRSCHLEKLPSNYKENMSYLLFEPWNEDTWLQKGKVFQRMIDEVIPMVIDDMPEDWYNLLEH